MEHIVIRKAKQNDLAVVLTLSDELSLSDLPYDKEVDINWAHTDKGKKYYSGKIQGNNGICFVAQVNGVIAGYLTAAIKEIPSYRLVKIAEVENLVVDKEKRSKGIGKALLNEFVKWAKEAGSDKVSVNVFSSNEKGISFYKREGFIPYDITFEMPLKKDDK